MPAQGWHPEPLSSCGGGVGGGGGPCSVLVSGGEGLGSPLRVESCWVFRLRMVGEGWGAPCPHPPSPPHHTGEWG